MSPHAHFSQRSADKYLNSCALLDMHRLMLTPAIAGHCGDRFIREVPIKRCERTQVGRGRSAAAESELPRRSCAPWDEKFQLNAVLCRQLDKRDWQTPEVPCLLSKADALKHDELSVEALFLNG